MPRPMPAVDAPLPGMRCRHDATCGAVISADVPVEFDQFQQQDKMRIRYAEHLIDAHAERPSLGLGSRLSPTMAAQVVDEFAAGIRAARLAAADARQARVVERAAAPSADGVTTGVATGSPGSPRFYRTLLVVEILGDQPYTGDLEDLGHAVTDGDFSGAVLSESTTTVDAAQMSALLTMQGSDPSFLLGDAGVTLTPDEWEDFHRSMATVATSGEVAPYRDGLRMRADGRQEVEDTAEANTAYGCSIDDWCILRDGHDGECNEDREFAP